MNFKERAAALSKRFTNAVTETCNKIEEKSDCMIEEAKMRMELSEKETERKNILESLALKVYGKYQQGECVGKELACDCKKLDEINSDISALNASILQNKGKKICPECKSEISVADEFCPRCGCEQETEEEDSEENVCPCCGSVVSEDATYCNKCGWKL